MRADRVTFQLRGGLGNQLFQYAAGRAVALRLGVNLHLDTSLCGIEQGRHLLLDQFNIVAELKGGAGIKNNLHGWLRTKVAQRRGQLVNEEQGVIDQRIFQARPGAFFKGYWQKEDYFAAIASQLRNELTLKQPPTGANQAMREQIQSCESVGVHLRRGDYVHNSFNRMLFASCSLDYYARASGLIESRALRKPTYFLFSDEPEWARANITLPGPVEIVDINSHVNAHEDLRLMACCKHNIIANSTFSWWAAWLNANPDKIIVAPRTWYIKDLSNAYINAAQFQVIDNV